MTAATLGIWNHQASGGQVLKRPASLDATGSSNDSGTSDSATISSNDFLTLLVTEMKNQDPTATTDPNEYINQLVQVNSLEQLISINQTLISDSSGPAPSTQYASTIGARLAGSLAEQPRTATTQRAAPLSRSDLASPSRMLPLIPVQHAPGNLSIPQESPAALRVANALSGSSRQ